MHALHRSSRCPSLGGSLLQPQRLASQQEARKRWCLKSHEYNPCGKYQHTSKGSEQDGIIRAIARIRPVVHSWKLSRSCLICTKLHLRQFVGQFAAKELQLDLPGESLYHRCDRGEKVGNGIVGRSVNCIASTHDGSKPKAFVELLNEKWGLEGVRFETRVDSSSAILIKASKLSICRRNINYTYEEGSIWLPGRSNVCVDL